MNSVELEEERELHKDGPLCFAIVAQSVTNCSKSLLGSVD